MKRSSILLNTQIPEFIRRENIGEASSKTQMGPMAGLREDRLLHIDYRRGHVWWVWSVHGCNGDPITSCRSN